MSSLRHLFGLAALSTLFLTACSSPPGRPNENSEVLAPSDVTDFSTLYAQNCAACHGADGRNGAAIELASPVYLAIIDKSTLRNVIANGVRGTSMAAFAQSAGGMLTDKQVDSIANGIFSHWARAGILDGTNPPSYTAKTAGNAANGLLVYATYCASCHGPEGQGGSKGSAITNDSFLALLTDQELRTMVITGRPELGAPDWRNNVPGKPMSDQEITDVVAWLASRRVQNPGQPYSAANYEKH
ncbi:MAG TPA: c-type cytochrome [Terriglobales bacterium]|nr:c-type cytochrome [Terriglobales bacterium]